MRSVMVVVVLLCLQQELVVCVSAQQYEVRDIRCSKSHSQSQDNLEAILRKPEDFQGDPFFPDNRNIDPKSDSLCRIRKINSDASGSTYLLKIVDFDKCRVKIKDDYLTVRVWFPRLQAVILANDQDVVIMCKPPNPTITKVHSAGFSGNIQNIGRVSGVVEKTPSSLEYSLELHKESTPRSGIFDLPLSESISIGTRLQLTASIDTKSAWKYAKLMEVSVSNDPKNPSARGYIKLVENGCRNQQYATIVPNQPIRPDNRSGEVVLQFEAFMLENMQSTERLWIHSEVKACMEAVDCIAQFCMDLFQPSGHGRRKRQVNRQFPLQQFLLRRAMPSEETRYRRPTIKKNGSKSIASKNVLEEIPMDDREKRETSFDENIGISILIPETEDHSEVVELSSQDSCWVFVIASCTAGALLCISVVAIIVLVCRLSSRTDQKNDAKSVMDDIWTLHSNNKQHMEKSMVEKLSLPRSNFTLAKRVGPSNTNQAELYVEEPGKLAGNSIRT